MSVHSNRLKSTLFDLSLQPIVVSGTHLKDKITVSLKKLRIYCYST
jgi:hypothetical protein